MFSNLRKITDLNNEIASLEKTVQNLIADLAAKDEAIFKANREMRFSTFVFDFDKFHVFSIERRWSEYRSITSIGFYNQWAHHKDNEKSIIEWYFDCDESVHKNICEQWETWKKGQKNATFP